MTQDKSFQFSALVFQTPRKLDVGRAVQSVASLLETIGLRLEKIEAVSNTTYQLLCSGYGLRITELRDVKIGQFEKPVDRLLAVHLVRRVGDDQHEVFVPYDATLLCVLHVLHRQLGADYVQLKSKDILFDAVEFADHTNNMETVIRAMREAANLETTRDFMADQEVSGTTLPGPFEPAELVGTPDAQRTLFSTMRETAEPLVQTSSRDLEVESPLCRLSAWFMSFSVAILCLPVGVTLMIINLLRGENLRLSSQTAALTGTFVALQSMGSMAQAATVIGQLLP